MRGGRNKKYDCDIYRMRYSTRRACPYGMTHDRCRPCLSWKTSRRTSSVNMFVVRTTSESEPTVCGAREENPHHNIHELKVPSIYQSMPLAYEGMDMHAFIFKVNKDK